MRFIDAETLKTLRNAGLGAGTAVAGGHMLGRDDKVSAFLDGMDNIDDHIQKMVGRILGCKNFEKDEEVILNHYNLQGLWGHPMLYEWRINALDIAMLPIGCGIGAVLKAALLNAGFTLGMAKLINNDDLLNIEGHNSNDLFYLSKRLVNKWFVVSEVTHSDGRKFFSIKCK